MGVLNLITMIGVIVYKKRFWNQNEDDLSAKDIYFSLGGEKDSLYF